MSLDSASISSGYSVVHLLREDRRLFAPAPAPYGGKGRAVEWALENLIVARLDADGPLWPEKPAEGPSEPVPDDYDERPPLQLRVRISRQVLRRAHREAGLDRSEVEEFLQLLLDRAILDRRAA